LETTAPSARGRGRSPSLAALLSFLWPGLGQLYLRNRRLAAIFAVPSLVVVLLLAYGLRRGPVVFAADLFANRVFGLAAIAVLLLFGAWRLASVVLAFLGGGGSKTSRIVDRAVLAGLAAVIAVTHLGSGFYLLAVSNGVSPIFSSPNPSFIDLTTPVPSPNSSGGAGPGPSTVATPSINSRITILFTGFDSVPGRGETLYDSLLIVSYDPASNSVQMLSLPRDSTSFPLYFGKHVVVPTWLRINSIPTNVEKGGIVGSPDSPYMTLVNEVSYLAGIHIDYYAAMDLNGFVKMIDAVGGIDVVNPAVINDGQYDWLNGAPYGFYLAAGPQHLDGMHALAYVRSRKSAGDNDFGRSSRQQQVLVALLHKMAQPDQILNLPNLISTLGSSVSTNFPADRVADYIAIGQNIPSENFKHVVLDPSAGYSEYLPSGALCLFNSRVADESVTLFGQDSLWYNKPVPANTCPAS
jgi:LCP family protein required for cell wall assembly